MVNRRKFPRIPLVTTARVTPEGLQTSSEAIVRDISIQGMGVFLKTPCQKGDILLIKVSILTDGGSFLKESVMGRVVWATRVEEKNGYNAGIEFHAMEQKNPKLYEYVKGLEKQDQG